MQNPDLNEQPPTPAARNTFLRRAVPTGLMLFCLAAVSAQPAGPVPSGPTVLEQAYAKDEGSEGKRDAAAAAALYQQAADAGDAFAHFRLGYLAETGDGVPQNYAAARAHYQAAADAGVAAARVRLALCHLEGWGGPVDRPAFVRELRLAGDAGDVSAQRILGQVYFYGFAVPADRAEGLRWLELAAKQDDASSQYQIGLRLEQPRLRNLMANVAVSRNWYRLSAENEYRASMRAMSRTFLVAPRAARDWTLGHQWLELATEAGDAEAPYILAVVELLHADSPARDETKARAWLELAAERKNERAAEVLRLAGTGRGLADSIRYTLQAAGADRYMDHANEVIVDQVGRNEPPRLIRAVPPTYPKAAYLTKESGRVELEFVVNTEGKVIEPRVLASAHPVLNDAALEAIVQWQFRPGRKDGKPVNVRVVVPLEFKAEAEELLDGVDGLLRNAAAQADKLGTIPATDHQDLRMGRFVNPPQKPPLIDGKPLPADGRAMFIVCLDATGKPLRVHTLLAEPADVGPMMSGWILQQEFEPRLIDGTAVPSNAVLIHASGKYRPESVIR